MGEVFPAMVAVTSPPVIIRGVAVVGHQVLDGQYRNAPSGVIRGYDAVSGELAWAWDMLNPQRKGLPAEGEEYAQGTPNSWDDRVGRRGARSRVRADGQLVSGSRTEIENRYNTAVVALDATSGDVRWSFQTVHIDVWDYDLGRTQPDRLAHEQ